MSPFLPCLPSSPSARLYLQDIKSARRGFRKNFPNFGYLRKSCCSYSSARKSTSATRLQNCLPILGVIVLALLVRMLGVYLCVIKSKLNGKERLFCMIAYTPKATVQAAIGALPLAMGLSCGETILTAAVLAILLTAPLGAWLTDITYRKLLSRSIEFKIPQTAATEPAHSFSASEPEKNTQDT